MRTRYNKRIDRANRTRSALARKARGRLRLSIFRSSKHIYAQVIDDVRGVTLAAASTIDKSLKDKLSKTTDMAAASEVGKLVAERAKAAAASAASKGRSS